MSDNNDGYFDVYENDGQEVNDENGHNNEGLATGGELTGNDTNQNEMNNDDPEVSQIKKRVKEMEEEAAKLKQLQTEMEQHMQTMGPAIPVTLEDKIDADSRSIYVGNVDYSATAQELEAHFHGCGSINRVTILCDKFTGHPKGFAYVEFVDKDSVQTAMALDDSLFKGRRIKVVSKRTNKPGISTTDRGRGRGASLMRGRGMRGGYNPYMPSFRGRGIRGRARGFYHYAPY